jgi:hypothetical protein
MTTGTLRRETAACIMSTGRDPRFDVDVLIMNDRPYESSLNRAARDAIAAGADWWLHIDSDQYWTKNPLDAIEADHDLVTFPAPLYHVGKGTNAPVIGFNVWNMVNPDKWDRVRPVEFNHDMQTVDVIGSGAFLMKVAALRDAKIPAPFARRYDADGVTDRGCDVEFCRKWYEAGRKIHANFGCVCGHFHSLDLLEVMSDMMTLQAKAKEVSDGCD